MNAKAVTTKDKIRLKFSQGESAEIRIHFGKQIRSKMHGVILHNNAKKQAFNERTNL